jgi:hypothetical protein
MWTNFTRAGGGDRRWIFCTVHLICKSRATMYSGRRHTHGDTQEDPPRLTLSYYNTVGGGDSMKGRTEGGCCKRAVYTLTTLYILFLFF